MPRQPSSGSACPIFTKSWDGGRGPERRALVLGQAAPSLSLPDMTRLFAPASAATHATLAELKAFFMAEHDLKGQHRLPLEKAAGTRIDAQKKSLRAAEQDRADIAKARDEWLASQPANFFFFFFFVKKAPRGQRLVAPVPHGHWMTTTFVAALRHDEITAPCVFDGPMDGASFLTYVEHFLAPTLRQAMSS